MKDLLGTCRQNVLDSNQELKLISSSGDASKSDSTRVDYIANPGQIYEDDVYYMAKQILKGLAYLEKQQVQIELHTKQ